MFVWLGRLDGTVLLRQTTAATMKRTGEGDNERNGHKATQQRGARGRLDPQKQQQQDNNTKQQQHTGQHTGQQKENAARRLAFFSLCQLFSFLFSWTARQTRPETKTRGQTKERKEDKGLRRQDPQRAEKARHGSTGRLRVALRIGADGGSLHPSRFLC